MSTNSIMTSLHWIIIGANAAVHNIAILFNGPMNDGDVDDQMNDVDIYHGAD